MSQSHRLVGAVALCGLLLGVAGAGCSTSDAADDDDDDAGETGSSSGGAMVSSSSSSGAGGSSSSSSSGGSSGTGASSGSSGGSSSSSGGDAGDGCTLITLGEFALGHSNGSGEDQFALYKASITPDLLGENEVIDMQLSGSDAPGSFDLSLEPQYATCDHCFILTTGTTQTNVYFFQSEGDFTVTSASFDTGALEATLVGGKMIEVTRDNTGTTTPVANGRCLTIADATISVPGADD